MSVEEYIAKFPEERQDALRQIREMLQKSFPKLEETMQYSMPTYGMNGEILFSFASQKNYLAFYACHYDLLEQFKDITDNYNCGKSCIRFRKCDSEVLNNLKKISASIYKNVESSTFFGKHRMK